jgi:cold-inducible RNA-binding protein
MHQARKILIGNLSTDAEEEQIRGVFSEHSAQVSAVSMPKHPKTGLSLGYAFVEMRNLIDAREAVSALQGKSINGRKLTMSLVDAIKKAPKWYQFGFGQ